MASGESSAVLRQVRTLFDTGAAGGLSDGQLLERFRASETGPEAEAAFAVLVARHGPLVLGVCRRLLRNPDDVADAFQATFLVLVRKAGSVRVDDSLGRWLYGVSRRVAARARADAARRAAREGSEPPVERPGPLGEDEVERRELIEAVDQEVSRLPEVFRAVVVLCDIGGMTHEDAARHVGCPVGTVESRLSRGRRRLRVQLARRGLAPSAVLPAWLITPTVPESLSLSTVAAATRAATVSAPILALLEGVILDMTRAKLKSLAIALGAFALTCGLAVTAGLQLLADDRPRPTPARSTPARQRTTKADAIGLQPPAPVEPGDVLLVEVLEALPGRPISGTRLVRPDGTISLGFYGDVSVAGLTRDEVKVKVVEHLRKFLPDDVLGLSDFDESGNRIPVDPKNSNRLFVDDSLKYERDRSAQAAPRWSAIPKHDEEDVEATLLVISQRLGRIVDALEEGSKGDKGPAPGRAPATGRRDDDLGRRIESIESKLDRLIQAVDRMKPRDGR